MSIIDAINAMPDAMRIGIIGAIRIIAWIHGWTAYEDGSMAP
jgi:hypothetical protein